MKNAITWFEIGTADLAHATLQAGEYLVFSATGSMPQTVVQTWGLVWQYFQNNPNVQRSYATDFEAYLGTDRVEIHMASRNSSLNLLYK